MKTKTPRAKPAMKFTTTVKSKEGKVLITHTPDNGGASIISYTYTPSQAREFALLLLTQATKADGMQTAIYNGQFVFTPGA